MADSAPSAMSCRHRSVEQGFGGVTGCVCWGHPGLYRAPAAAALECKPNTSERGFLMGTGQLGGKQRPHSGPNHSDEMSTSHGMKTSAHQSSSKVQVLKRNTEGRRGSCDHVIGNEYVFWFSFPKPHPESNGSIFCYNTWFLPSVPEIISEPRR